VFVLDPSVGCFGLCFGVASLIVVVGVLVYALVLPWVFALPVGFDTPLLFLD